ncbi:Calx-beta domain-containing protein [Rivularia sp. PCC 7116]|uniref:DUF4114 domain-containing protein n=1 Tax=Rivularia sp. PCC 7116 TaxID=373994 RepID=UPI00029EC9E3|nr:DUF4114 domain-containing protein [Rivularia sp. PCC 7116]AFY54530.1 Calx-beta domain-containing protein [Rivularia sp. PCC 7116]
MTDNLNGIKEINNVASSPEVEVTLGVDMMSVAENSGKEIKYTFTRKNNTELREVRADASNSTSVDTSKDLIVNFSIAGKAQLDKDYKLDGAEMDGSKYTVTIPADATTAEVTITPIADSEIESDEAVKLTLETGKDYSIDRNLQQFEVSEAVFLKNSLVDDKAVMAVITNDDPMLDAPWAKQFGSNGYGYEYLAVDDEGNTYVTGDFTGAVTIGNQTITSKGGKDIFVAKFDKDGNVQWAQEYGGTNFDNADNITVDDSGNTFVVGTFSKQTTLGDKTLAVTGDGYGSDAFVTKIDSTGKVDWAKRLNGTERTVVYGIEADAQGNSYITGDFGGQITLDNINLGGESGDIFVAKFDTDGGVSWAKEFGNNDFSSQAEDIVVDKEGNAYLFMTEGNEGNDNIVVSKLNKTDGSEGWKQTFGDSNNWVVAEGIAIDDKDNIFIAGEFEETVTFGATPDAPTLEGGENGDVFVAKLDSSDKGKVLWATDFDSQNKDEDYVQIGGIAVDKMSNTYVTGYYDNGSMSVGDFMLYDEGGEGGEGENAFIAKLDDKGKVKWAQNIGGKNYEEITDIAVKDNKIYLAGEFYEEATFGEKSLKASNFDDTFLVKLAKEKPEISLKADSTTITEGDSKQITYTFTRKGDFTQELTVKFSVTGTATFNQDFTLTGEEKFDGKSGEVKFEAGKETATVTLNITDDSDAEEDETLALELAMGSGYMISATEAKTSITIAKDEKDIVIVSGSDDDDTEFTLASNSKQTFKFKSKFKSGKSSIKFSFKSKSVAEFKEIAIVTVDDDEGTIDGLSTGDEGYIEAALNRSKSIFSLLGNIPQGFGDIDIEKVLEFSSETSFRFLSVKGGTLQGVKQGKVNKSQVTVSSTDFLQVSESEKNSFDLDFEGVKIKMKFDAKAKKAIGSGLQEKIEVLDLRSDELSGKQKVKCTVNREAAYNNFVGFYQVIDEDGGIDTNGDGTVDVLVGDAGYAQAAVQNRIASIDLSVENQSTAEFTGEFTAGAIIVPFLMVNGNPEAFEEIFFPFIEANSDGVDHVMMLGENTFGFEDLTGGGDGDYNDFIVKVDFTSVDLTSVST